MTVASSFRNQDGSGSARAGKKVNLASLPIRFDPNVGQAPSAESFTAHAGTMGIGIGADRLRLGLPHGQSVRMLLRGANAGAAFQATEKSSSQVNYLLGSHPENWRTHIAEYGRVTFRNVYPGVDLTFYGSGTRLEHDFILGPGADVSQIRMKYEGAKSVAIDGGGNLHVSTQDGDLVVHAPQVYQTVDGRREYRKGGFARRSATEVGFRVAGVDRRLPLVIDPVFDYSTYLADMSLYTSGVATDAAGSTYVVGETFSTSYPVTPAAVQHTCSSCPSTTNGDLFITKLNATGTAQVYSTYLGGSGFEQPAAIAVDGNGNAAITGFTSSADFPLKNPISSGAPSGSDGFIASLSPDGSALNFSSRLGGGSEFTDGESVTTDASGNVYVSGTTESPSLPVTAGALNAGTPAYSQAKIFLTKIHLNGTLAFSAIVGDPGRASGGVGTAGLAVQSSGAIGMAGTVGAFPGPSVPWVTTAGAFQSALIGSNENAPFVATIAPDGSKLLNSSLVGSGKALAMTLDAAGDFIVLGEAGSQFPVPAGAYSADGTQADFIARVSGDATKLLSATYFGPKGGSPTGIALDSTGNVWIAGSTPPGIPLVNPMESNPGSASIGSTRTSFVAEFDSALQSLLFSTYVTSRSAQTLISGIAMDTKDRLHIVGTTQDDFPTTNGAFLGKVTPPPPNYFYNYGFAAMIETAAPAPGICIANDNGVAVEIGTSGQGSFGITNCGTVALNISSLEVQSPVFALPTSTPCLGALAPGASCTVTYTFTPAGAGPASATLIINSNAPVAAQAVTIYGNGTVPSISVPLSTLQFSPQVVGAGAKNGVVPILNQGTAPLIIDGGKTAATAPFKIVANSCTSPLPILGSGGCAITLAYQPTVPGNDAGTLTIYSNDPVHPTTTVALSGTAVASYGTPTISTLQPQAVPLNATGVTLQISGSNFFPTSQVFVDGEPVPTTYVDGSNLSATVDPSLLIAVGDLPITVSNPSPGGLGSVSNLAVYRTVPVSATNLVYDSSRKLLYAAVPSTAPSNANTIVSIDPLTGTLGTPIPVGKDPAKLALSDDASYLYVGLNGDHALQRVSLQSQQVDRTFALPTDSTTGATTVNDMHVVPGTPTNVVVSLTRLASPSEAGAALYTDAGLASFLSNDPSGKYFTLDAFTFTSDPTTIYGYPFANGFFNTNGVGSTALTPISNTPYGTCCDQASGSLVASDGKLLYTNSGQVWDPKAQKLLGTYVRSDSSNLTLFYEDSVVADPTSGRTFFLDRGSDILSFDEASFKQASSLNVPLVTLPYGTDLLRWGADGLAFRAYQYETPDHSKDSVLLFRSSITETGTGGAPSVSALSPAGATAGGNNFLLELTGSGFIPGSSVLWNGNARETIFSSATELAALIPASDLVRGTATVTVANPGGGTSSGLAFRISGPALSLSGNTLSFGTVQLGTSSPASSLTLTNSGDAAFAAPATYAVSGSNAADFSVAGNCTTALAVGATCNVSVTFKPSSSGAETATLTLTAPGTPFQAVALTGTGAQPDFSVSAANGTSASVQSGQPAAYSFALSATPGFSGAIALTCSNLPQYATCIFSPVTLNVAAASSANFALTISTQTTSTALYRKFERGYARVVEAGFGLMSLLGVPLLCTRKRWRGLVTSRLACGLAVVAIALVAGSGLIGCGGSGGSAPNPTPTVFHTPSGTYTVNVIATSGAVSHSTPLTLVVQ